MPARNEASIRTAASVCALFQDTVAQHPDRVALKSSDGAIRLTWSEYDKRVRAIAAGFHRLGVRKGDTVALMMVNRPEFHLVDSALMHLGALPFSIYQTAPTNQICFLLTHSEARLVVCEEEYLARVTAAIPGTHVSQMVCIEVSDAEVMSLADIENSPDSDFDFDATWRAIGPNDILSLIYTSGTSGAPKGVELTHANLLFCIACFRALSPVDETDRVLSYLPDAHIVNRYMAQYTPAVFGCEVTTVANPKALIATLPAVRPTLFVGVPQLWYKVKSALEARLDSSVGVTGALGRWAIAAGANYATDSLQGRTPSISTRLARGIADRLVLRRLRARLGLDKVRFAVSGAAPVAPEVLAFFLGIGITVCEAWGMSELSTFATVNLPGDVRVGTVGKVIPGVELRFEPDGEILVRGGGVMKGYRNDPTRTAAAIDADGWMRTEDVGSIDEDGFVRILDRKKELIITAGGKNMSPSNIENQLRVACPLIGSAAAIGDRRPYIVALVSLDPDAARSFAEAHGIPDDPSVLAADSRLLDAVDAGVAAANDRLSRVEQIKRVMVLPTYWAADGEELTAKMSLKRKAISTKYAAEIDFLYARSAASTRPN